MKTAKIKETGAEIPVIEVDGGYQSYLTEKIYSVNDVEIIEDKPDDFGVDSEIKDLQNKIAYRKDNISVAECGIAWLEKYKHDIDAPGIKVRFSFLDNEFSVDKSECMALIQKIKYEQEQMLRMDEYFIERLKTMKSQNNKPNILGISVN